MKGFSQERLFKGLDIFLILFGRIFAALLTLATVKVATTLLSPEQFGRYSLLLALGTGFSMCLISPVGSFVMRKVHAWRDAGTLKQHFITYGLYFLAVTLAAMFVAAVLQYTTGLIPLATMGMVCLLIGGWVLANNANQTFIPLSNILGHPKIYVYYTLFTLASALAFSIFMVRWQGYTAENWFMGQILGYALFACLGGLVFFKTVCKDVTRTNFSPPSAEQMKALAAFSLPLLLTIPLMWVQTQAYRFIITPMVGLEALAFFVAGYGIAAAGISLFESVFTAYFLPQFYKQVAIDEPFEQIKAWVLYAKAVIPALLLTMTFIALFSNELTWVLLGPQFKQSAQYIFWGVLAEGARVLVSTYAYLAQARMQTKYLIAAYALGAVVALVAVSLLTPQYQLIGTGMGLACAGFAALTSVHVILSRYSRVLLPWRSIIYAVFYSLVAVLAYQFIVNAFLFNNAISATVAVATPLGLLYTVMMFQLVMPVIRVK